MNTLNCNPIKGFKDVDGKIAYIVYRIKSLCEKVVIAYGCQPLETPIVEREELFVKSLGDASDVVTKEIFRLDHPDHLILRPEQTCSVMRWSIKNRWDLTGQPRVFSFGPMFRHENPQKGRWRQFNQFNIEFINSRNPIHDMELLLLTNDIINDILKEFNLPKNFFTLQINTIGSIENRRQYEQYLKDNIHNNMIYSEEVRNKVMNNPLKVFDTKNINDLQLLTQLQPLKNFLDEGAVDRFNNIQTQLDKFHISYEVNPYLVRGLDYYNDLVFEWVINNTEWVKSTIIAGGRYDQLPFTLTKKYNFPNIGCAVGIDRLADYLLSLDISIHNKIIPICNLDGSDHYVLKVAYNVQTLMPCQILNHKKLIDQLGFINKNQDIFSNKIIIVGSNEELDNNIILKVLNDDVDTSYQKVININDLNMADLS